MRVPILKSFPFSRDGFTPSQALANTTEDIPDALVDGLQVAGYVGKSADMQHSPTLPVTAPEIPVLKSPENQVLAAAPENRDDVPRRDRGKRRK